MQTSPESIQKETLIIQVKGYIFIPNPLKAWQF